MTERPDPFFVIGLPRSGTAWASVALTCGPVACLHDTVRGSRTFSEFAERVVSQRAYAELIGEASPSLCAYSGAIAERWPNARYVFVWREQASAGSAYARMLQRFAPLTSEVWHKIVEIRNAHRLALVDHHVLDITFEELFSIEGMRRIWCHVASTHEDKFPEGRIRQLIDMRVAVDPSLVLFHDPQPCWPEPAKVRPDYIPVLGDETGGSAEADYCAFVRTLCGSNNAAYQWFVDVISVVKLWDHIHDGDAIHRGYALVAIEQVVLGWPANTFWKRHRPLLQEALSVSVAAWKAGNATDNIADQYAGYRHLVFAIAAALKRKVDLPVITQIMKDLIASEPRMQPVHRCQ